MSKRVAFYVGIMLVLFVILNEVNTEPSVQKGRYKMKLDELRNCTKTTFPMAPDSMVDLKIRITDQGMFQGVFTVRKNNVKYIKFKSDTFLWEDGRWNLIQRIPGWTCHRYFWELLLTAMTIKYDKTKCSLTEGSYHFNNIDVDWFSHVWRSEIDYGRMLAKVEFLNSKYTYMCIEIELSTTPI